MRLRKNTGILTDKDLKIDIENMQRSQAEAHEVIKTLNEDEKAILYKLKISRFPIPPDMIDVHHAIYKACLERRNLLRHDMGLDSLREQTLINNDMNHDEDYLLLLDQEEAMIHDCFGGIDLKDIDWDTV